MNLGDETVGFSGSCVVMPCPDLIDAAQWTLGLNELPWFGFGNGPEATGLGVNECGQKCGFGRLPQTFDPPNCRQHVGFWSDELSAEVDLHVETGLPADAETIGNSISNRRTLDDGTLTEILEVAGANLSINRAHRWERDSEGNWTVTDVYASADNVCPPFCPGWLSVNEATDINDDGFMSAWGVDAQNVSGGSTVTLAALVRPIQFRECWADAPPRATVACR